LAGRASRFVLFPEIRRDMVYFAALLTPKILCCQQVILQPCGTSLASALRGRAARCRLWKPAPRALYDVGAGEGPFADQRIIGSVGVFATSTSARRT